MCNRLGYAQNQIRCEIVALASELIVWMQMLALAGPARRWEPKRLRLRIFNVAGRLARGGRRLAAPIPLPESDTREAGAVSIAMMNWVWTNSPTSGNERPVLLALARRPPTRRRYRLRW